MLIFTVGELLLETTIFVCRNTFRFASYLIWGSQQSREERLMEEFYLISNKMKREIQRLENIKTIES